MQILRIFGLLATSLLLVSATHAGDVSNDGQDDWLKSVHDAWAEEDREFKNSPTSPLAGSARFEISETGTVYFAETDRQLGWSTEQGDQAAFSLANRNGQWIWTVLAGNTTLARAEQTLPSGSALAAGDSAKSGRFTVEFYPSEDAVTVLVFDPETKRRAAFENLDRFEADPKFAINARIMRFDTPEQLELITARQQFKKQYRYAKLHFEIDGAELELAAFKHALEGEGSNILFVPFSDRTSSRQTYGGGRYLMVEEPADSDEVLIDFNLVTNPLCSYAPIYNCILPPQENRLPIAIEAGVRKYH